MLRLKLRNASVASCTAVLLYMSTCIYLGNCVSDEIKVTSRAGTFNGYLETVDKDNKLIVAKFLGIPYAEPPIGERRFAKPVSKAPLDTAYDALYFSPACKYGKNIKALGFPKRTSEDCLYLNVYVPHKKTSSSQEPISYPVMIWIHGGGFEWGYSDPYTADTLSTFGEVIVVTINYRLSIWGFGSTGDDNLPGNYGLWDQHTAIQWVHDNIASFGGDTSRVTLFGDSAGAASASYQGFFPGNEGLVHRVIAQSGSLLSPWAFKPSPMMEFRQVAVTAGCAPNNNTNTEEMVACMRQLPENKLEAAVKKNMAYVFGPVVDGSFIITWPEDMARGKKGGASRLELFRSLDLLNGVTNAEGFVVFPIEFFGDRFRDTENVAISKEFLESFVSHLPHIVVSSHNERNAILQEFVVAEYTDWSNPENSTIRRDQFMQLIADFEVNVPQVITSNRHATNNKQSKTFLYHMDFTPTVNGLAMPSWGKGLNHASDLPYVFGFDKGMVESFPALQGTSTFRGPQLHPFDKDISDQVMTMWTNFAKSG